MRLTISTLTLTIFTKENKMNKYKMEMNNIAELLIGKEYHSTARTGWGTILEAKSRGDVHFPGAYVFAVRVSRNNYDPTSKEFWATVGVFA
jgi:hypothetical protein